MNLSELAQSGRQPPLPLSLDLPESSLQFDRWLRVLPGQRYVGLARWQGQPVLAKVLVGPKGIKNFHKELAGAQYLATPPLDSPRLLVQTLLSDGGCLVFEYLAESQSLGEAWQAVAHELSCTQAQQAILAEALQAIAQLHRLGLWQSDLHLDNLLRHQNKLYWIDGGGVQVEALGQPLSSVRIEENLGVFFAQLSPELSLHLDALLSLYQQHNPVVLSLAAVSEHCARVRRWRVRDYLKKAGRDCSLFSAQRGATGLRVVWRAALPELETLLQAPDTFIAQGHIYKTGGAATVARVLYQGKPLVVKRYNIKNFAHWLKRFWRPSRAWHSWLEAQRLKLSGIATPLPLAVMERRWCGLRGPAWLVSEYLDGSDILTCFADHLDGSVPEQQLQALDRLFAALVRERISHGDLKGYNILWDAQLGQWSLIDLDAMQQHTSDSRFAKAYRQDRARFLRNWPEGSALHQLLAQRLPKL